MPQPRPTSIRNRTSDRRAIRLPPLLPPTAPDGNTTTPETGAKPAPGGTPDAKPRGAGTPDGASKSPAEGDKSDEDDKDPYEGIAPDELPPDLQYDADSSVSFPTNI